MDAVPAPPPKLDCVPWNAGEPQSLQASPPGTPPPHPRAEGAAPGDVLSVPWSGGDLSEARRFALHPQPDYVAVALSKLMMECRH